MNVQQVHPIQNFVIEKLQLTTHNNQYINLALNYAELNLFESIFSPVVYGSVLLTDKFNFDTYGPIIGGEEIELILDNIRTGQQKIKDETKISYTFVVLSIENRVVQKNRLQVYELKFVSKEALYNQQVRISSTFLGKKYSKIAADVMETMFTEISKLSPKERKDTKERKRKGFVRMNAFTQESEPRVSVHFPNLHPFDCLVYLSGKANTNTKGNPYFFYESLDRLFYFGSYKDHFFFDHTKEKYLDVKNVSKEGNKLILFNNNQVNLLNTAFPHAEEDFYAATKHAFTKDFDFLENAKKGVYANRLFTYDFTKKLIKKYEYDYIRNYSTIPRIYKPKSKALMLEKGAPEFKTPYYPETFIKTAFIHSSAFLTGTNDFTPHITKNSRYQKFQELNSGLIELNIPGDITMYCGKFYDLYLNSPDVSTSDDLKTDPHSGGTYFCLRVRHCFKPDEYITSLELAKDSFMENTLQTFPQSGQRRLNDQKEI